MTAGDHVQTTKAITGSKRNVYAGDKELLTVFSVAYFPVLIVTKYAEKSRFAVRAEHVTTELRTRYKQHIKADLKNKTLTKWQ